MNKIKIFQGSTLSFLQSEVNDFAEKHKIINTLLRKGIISEETINSKKGKNYIPPTNEELKEAIDCIKNIYSAIIKSTIADKNKGSFTGNRTELINKGYDPCKRCRP